MRHSRRFAVLTVIAAIACTSTPALASDDTSPTQPLGASASAPPSPDALIARLESALSAVRTAPVSQERKNEVIKKIEEALKKLRSGKALEPSDANELSSAISSVLGATPPPPSPSPGSSSVAPPPPAAGSTTTPSVPKPPSTPGSTGSTMPASNRDLISKLESAINAVKASPASEAKKAEVLKKIEEALKELRSGDTLSQEEMTKLSIAISALMGNGSQPSQPATQPTPSGTQPNSSVATPPGMNLTQVIDQTIERVRASSISDAKRKDLLAKLTDLRAKSLKTPGPSSESVKALFEEVNKALGTPTKDPQPSAGSEPSRGSTEPSETESTEPFNRATNQAEALRELQKRLDEASSRLLKLEQTDAVKAALAALADLKASLDSGTPPDPSAVRAVFEQIRSIVSGRTGRDMASPDEKPAPPSIEKMKAKMSGALSDAVNRLKDVSSPDADAARAAVQALLEKLPQATDPEATKAEFESAMELVHKALEKLPGARDAVRLAGVIAAVQASSAPQEVKDRIATVLKAAQDTAALHPEVDSHEAVKKALEDARKERIAAAVDRIGQLIPALVDAADAVSDADAALLLQQSLVLLQPSDGSLPTPEVIHEVHDLIASAIELIASHAPEGSDPEPGDGTAPDESTPPAPPVSEDDVSEAPSR